MGIGGTKTGRFPLNPGYSRVMGFEKKLRVDGGEFNPFRVVTIDETLPKVGPLS
jgi:hypothetical protein